MKKILAVLAFLSTFLIQASAQFGNEWINFSQSYYKIPVANDGIYRLNYSDLQSAGFPVGSVDPQTIRLFHRGAEQAIYIEGENDGTFHQSDFIEFYGRRNDGTQDAELYKPASAQPHQYYNLYSDTTAYFLTFSAGVGKRMALISEVNDGLAADAFHMQEKLVLVTEQFTAGAVYGTDIQYTHFDQGEGWTGRRLLATDVRSYDIAGISNGLASGGKPRLEIFLVGRNVNAHRAEIYLGTSQRLVATLNFSGTTILKHFQEVEWSDIAANGTLSVTIKATAPSDRLSVSYFKLTYPQTFDASAQNEKVLNIQAHAAGRSYIEIQNPVPGLRLFDITDPGSVRRVESNTTVSLNAVISDTQISRKVLATSTTRVPSVHRVRFREIHPDEHDYIMISHPILRKPALGYSDPVKDYASYRASPAGGSYDTLLMNVQDLYDQFNYGELSPLAIHHFMKFLAATKLPRYLFIIGKGLEIDYNYNRSPGDFALYKDLIPSAGTPASDAYYTAGIAGSQHTAAVPTGRITASSPEHVAAYLNKVKEREMMPFDNLSRKHLLHLSGGIEEGEPARFKSYVQDFEAVAEGYFLGGKVASIAKQSADVELINIAKEVNNGLNLVTFFGHSSASTLDFDIGYVTDPVMGYNNKGKYPMMLMHGCNAGSFFQEDMLFGEDWIFAQDKGAVGFIAHTFFGLEYNLKKYGDAFYAVAFGDSTFLSKGIGDIHKETGRRYMQTSAATAANITQVQQMILLGDPAVPLFGAAKPDLEVNANAISFESFNGEPITALTDSFAIKIVVRNFGQARPDTLRLQVERILSDNRVITYDTLILPVLYSDTVRFTIRKGRESGSGNNIFNITIDADDFVDELNELNNTASREFAVPLNGTRNLFPQDFSIVNAHNVTLSWQTTDVLSAERPFDVEVDTTHTFTSPFRKSIQVSGHVLGRQSLSLLSEDSVVYYWRTRLADPRPGESQSWAETSFTYIENGQEGWAQMDFPQYLKNITEGLVTDAVREELRFQETVTDVIIKTFGASHPSSNEDVSVKIGGAEYNLFTQSGGGFGCRYNTINLIAFDRRSTAPYIGIPFKYYDRAGRSCGREPWVINSFRPAELVTGNNDDVVAYVNNITNGDSVVIFSIGDAGYAAWPPAAKLKLAELGIAAAQLDALQPGEPVVIFGRKGAASGTAKVYTASNTPANAQLDVGETITGRYTSGSMSSMRIGPAAAWESFQLHVSDVEPQDDVRFDLLGVALNGTETVLFSDITASVDLSGISAAAYPYLKAVAKTEDATHLTSPQLDRWMVLYTPVPEGLTTFMGPAVQQTLIEGQPWQGHYGFINISEKSFPDSLTVRYETFNHPQSRLITNSMKIKAPAPGDTTTFSIGVNTKEQNGLNDIEVFVNPRVLPEQYYDNNIVALKHHLLVQMDNFSPVLEVTVDGRKLVNGDFVSTNPTIVARVWDENRHLVKTDTEGMRLFLTYPCDTEVCHPILIDLSTETVRWFAATDTSDFRLVFTPATLAPGKYTLLVEAADARGNGSGAEPYQVDFIVTDETSFSILSPYPNPFYDEVYFSARITGAAEPGAVEMQIVDVTGKVIRQFLPKQLHIGTNEWTWDGTDYAGNDVPTGVYICHVYLTVGGKQIQENRRVVFVR